MAAYACSRIFRRQIVGLIFAYTDNTLCCPPLIMGIDTLLCSTLRDRLICGQRTSNLRIFNLSLLNVYLGRSVAVLEGKEPQHPDWDGRSDGRVYVQLLRQRGAKIRGNVGERRKFRQEIRSRWCLIRAL